MNQYNWFLNNPTPTQVVLIVLITLWSIVWKVYAAYTAAKNNQKAWFVALFLLNTVGILEIFYLLKIAGKKWSDIRADFKNAFVSLKK